MSKITPEFAEKIQKRIQWQESLLKERKVDGLALANPMREGYIAALKWVLPEANR